MLEAAHSLYSRLVESGLGELDLSAVARLIGQTQERDPRNGSVTPSPSELS
jgi:hypothetical protein